MDRLGQILLYVEVLDARTSALVDQVSASANVMDRIAAHYDAIGQCDDDIDMMRQVIDENTSSMHALDQLHHKCFLLESNLKTNDQVTNQTTFEHLTTEYRHVVEGLQRNDRYQPKTPQPPQDDTFTTPDTGDYTMTNEANLTDHTSPMSIQHKLSLLNLRLKPIKCEKIKVNKKKSRYRLLSIYNLNPVAYESVPTPERPRTTLDSPMALDLNYDSRQFASESGEGDTGADELEINRLITGTSAQSVRFAEAHYTGSPRQHPPVDTDPYPAFLGDETLSQSIHDPIDYEMESDQQDLHVSPTFSTPKVIRGGLARFMLPPDEYLCDSSPLELRQVRKRLNSLPEEVELALREQRLQRLSHFISQGNLRPTTASYQPAQYDLNVAPDYIMFDDDDALIMLHELMTGDIHTSTTTLENFEQYLRGLRVDVSDLALNTPQKCSSHDSFLDEKHTKTFSSSYQYHNPIASVSATPTVAIATEDASCLFVAPELRTTQVLSEFISRHKDDATAQTPPNPSPGSFSLLLALLPLSRALPWVSPSKEVPKRAPPPTKKLSPTEDLANNFLELIKKSQTHGEQYHPPTPDKLRQIKDSMSKTGPIKASSSAQAMRQPIRIPGAIPGSHLRLYIGPNRTQVLCHGELLIFNKPRVSNVRQSALNDALSNL